MPFVFGFDRLRFVQGFLTKNDKEKIRDHGNRSVSAGLPVLSGSSLDRFDCSIFEENTPF